MGSVKISKPLSPQMVKDYWDDQYTSAHEAYYSESGQTQGRWDLELAARFGLHGAVTQEVFDRLADGQHPVTGEQLVQWRKPPVPDWAKDDNAWSIRLTDLLAEAAANGCPENPLALAKGSNPRLKPLPVVASEANVAPRVAERHEMTLLGIHRIAAAYFQEQLAGVTGKQAREYLKERGISDALAKEFSLGYSCKVDREFRRRLSTYTDDQLVEAGLFRRATDGRIYAAFRERIMFPIHDERGEVVAFGGRTLSKDESVPKYINSVASPIYSKRQVLYNLHRAQEHIEKSGRLVLQEGYLDAIASYGAGVKNVVATCGTSLSAEHVERIKQTVSGVVVNYDGDEAGWKAAKCATGKLLDAGLQVNVLTLPNGKDAAEFVQREGAKAFRKEISHAASVPKWLLEQEAKKVTGMNWTRAEALCRVREQLAPTMNPALRIKLEEQLRAALGSEPEKRASEYYAEHRSAYDFTIAPHKSVTAAAILGGDSRLIEAHEAAVSRVMQAAQEYTQARLHSSAVSNTGNALAARFTHIVARPVGGVPDPHLHTHAVVFNLTDDNGKVRAVQPLEWYRIQRYLDAVYQAEMAVSLQELGYKLDRKSVKAAAIDGYSKEFLESISRRTTEIERRKDELGFYGAKADHIIAHQSREPKVNWSPEQVRDYHRAKALEMGVDVDLIPSAARLQPYRRMEPEGAHIALTFAKHTLIDRNAVFDHYQVMEKALRFGLGSLRLDDVEHAMRFRESEFVKVSHYRPEAPGQRYTTPEMLTLEREVMETVLRGKNSVTPIAPEITRDDFRSAHAGRLNNQQLWLSYRVLTCPDRILGIQGGAGVGKTTALEPTRQIIEEHGFDVYGVAPTGRAASELTEVGITNAQTLQRFLVNVTPRSDRPLCIFLDESSLASTAQVHALFKKLQPKDRVILVGDVRQHQSVEAGRIFEQLQQAGMSTYKLTEIMRQKNAPELLEAVKAFAKEDVYRGLSIMEENGWIHQQPSQHKRYAALAGRYAQDPENSIAVAPSNEERLGLAECVRSALRDNAWIAEKEFIAPVLINRQELTSAEKEQAFSYEVGDVIRFGKSNKELGVRSREYRTVTAIDRDRNVLTLEGPEGASKCASNRLRGVQVFVRSEKAFSVGDKIQFTQPWREKRIDNRDFGSITFLDESGNVRMLLEGKRARQVSFNLKDMPHMDYGYAVTSYSVQSAAKENVLVHIAAEDTRTRLLVDRIFANVAVSRARVNCEIFCDSKEQLGPMLDRLNLKPKAHSRGQVEEYAKRLEVA